MMPLTRELLNPGTVIGGYVIERLLGHGGMSDVYLATDLADRQSVALKVLPHDAVHDPKRHERLHFEGRILQALRHPNICSLYEIGEANGRAYLAMEYLEGRTLHELLARERLSVDRVIEIACQLASALEQARRSRVVHRDLKDSNVMVLPSGAVKVLDFGLAKFAVSADQRLLNPVSRSTDPGLVFGTAEFMSPEQALGREVDHRSDLFSLGVLLYELLAGKLPFGGGTRMELFWAIVNGHPAPLADVNPAVSVALAEIVGRLLEKDTRVRYQTAHEVIVDLEAARKGLPVRRVALREARRQWSRRLVGCSMGIVLALAMTPVLEALSSIADDAFETNTPLSASVWTGTAAVHNLRSVISPAINPTAAWISNDGRVVYSTRRRQGRGGLWVAPPDGRSPVMIARAAEQAAVGWKGKHVYFTRDGDAGGLFKTSLAGGDALRLVGGRIRNPVVAPNAETVVFARSGATGFTLWAVPAGGGEAYQLSSFSSPEPPLISPDLRRIAIQRISGVLVCDAPACRNAVSLPVVSLVAWTPDSAGLAHTGAPGDANIWVTRISDGSLRQVTRFTGAVATSVSWSPDGRRLAVTRRRTLSDVDWLNLLR